MTATPVAIESRHHERARKLGRGRGLLRRHPGARAGGISIDTFEVELDCSPDEAKTALAQHTEDWGGEWTPRLTGGEIALPVAAGLRRGLVEGEVAFEPRRGGCRVLLEVTASAYRLNFAAVMILLFGAGAAIVLLLWPLFPDLLQLAPFAALMAFSSWFLVAARLRTSTPQDYLNDLAADLGREPETPADGDSEVREGIQT